MIETGRTDASLAAEISARVKKPPYVESQVPTVIDRTVARWRKGLVAPRYPEHMAFIAELSGNRITANQFVQPPQERPIRPFSFYYFPTSTDNEEFAKRQAERTRTSLKVEQVADALLMQLENVESPQAIDALALAAASILTTAGNVASIQENHFRFERALWQRLGWYR